MTIGTSSPSASPVKQIETRLGWMYFILRDGVLQIVSAVFEAKGTCVYAINGRNDRASCY